MALPRRSRPPAPVSFDALAQPPALRAILDARRGPLQPPIRSEIFGPQRFAQHGRSLAETHRAERVRSRRATFFPRLRDNIRTLREAHRYIGLQASTGYDISPAAEWLLDNFHLIEAQLEEVRDGLPRSYFRGLPVLQDEPLAGLPRVYGVAWAFVAHTDGAFDEDLLASFLVAYQEVRELRLSEMWALPTTLRVVLIENLRRLAERVAANKAARQIANLCSDRIDGFSEAALSEVFAPLEKRGVGAVFLAQMAQRLQDRRGNEEAGEALAVQAWLAQRLPDLAAVQRQQTADQAADNLSVSNAVTSLRIIGDADWPDIVARTSTLMRLMLEGSPVFAAEHTLTRDQTLHGIELLSERGGLSETTVARTLLQLMNAPTATPQEAPNDARGETADDIGAVADAQVAHHWLQGPGRPALREALKLNAPGLAAAAIPARVARLGQIRRVALPLYLSAVLLCTVGLVAWLLPSWRGADGLASALGWLAGLLMLLPASEAVVATINRLISESARPRHLARLALPEGIPAAHAVIVVIPSLLTDAASVHELAHRLELHHLANAERHAQFALLSDWADADTEQRPDDALLLAEALDRLGILNARHPTALGDAPRFILLHRGRRFSISEQRWIGWERKRGKLEALVAAIAQGTQGTQAGFLDFGESSRIAAGTRYVVTLDSDTQLPPGRLRELVSIAAHPQNRPRLSADGRRVVAGYTILQPRIVTPLPSARQATPYHWLFAGQCGIDPYSAATSEVYQDLFDEGSFSGKGLLHARAMHSVLANRLPDERVLSHDLIEGALARCAAVTDVTLVEEAPFHADVAASRVHRWTRGDWQLLPFLFGRAYGRPGAVNRWKMFDNLRRSLVAPASLALLLLALAGAGVSPWVALALVLSAFAAGPLMGAVAGFSPSRDDVAHLHFYRQAAVDLVRALTAALWMLAQLVQQALQAGDAIVRALYRMTVSRRHLLQWTTAAAAQATARTQLGAIARKHWRASAFALLVLAALLAAGTPHPVLAAVLCAAWAASPVWTWWVSRPRSVGARAPALAARGTDADELHGIARDTWRYFERCVTAADHHLPPDNLQTAPHDILAHRTSPTNIGLYLLTTACAREFGWIGTQDLLGRMEATLASLRTLERHRGHFLNWYDTQTRAPLLPKYVSTVDSGNLCGHLLASAQACLELAHAPHDPRAAQGALLAARRRMAPLLARRASLRGAEREQLRWQLADHRSTRRSARRDLAASPHEAAAFNETASLRLRSLAREFEQLAWEAEFGFLYHRQRHLLHIGYRVAEQQLDASFYDLLASESRLTSLLAIAKGDVPVRHWGSLGRPFYAVGADAGLRSWSGSMFEYLMPTLVLDEPHGSVLRTAGRAAVHEHIAFTREQAVPWGISESAYAGSDHTLAYQYAPQGVPRLALRRTPPHELVIAPYASALAALCEPQRATDNLRALQALGARGRYGFIEALDFTPARQTGGEAFTPVHTTMAHHQGMSIVALSNVLRGGVAQRWGMGNTRIEAVASLLHERAPREVLPMPVPPAGAPQQALQHRAPGLLREVQPGAGAVEPTHLLSNGRYGVSLRANGAGTSRWGTTGLTRSRDDALRDAHGSFVYLRRDPSEPWVSVTQHPAPDDAANYHSTYHADRVCFVATWPQVQAITTVWVSPEDDIEFRRVELHNRSDRAIEIELVSAFDLTLADPRADEAHPAFSNLFVRAGWQAGSQALVFERLPRLPTDRALHCAHFLADHDPQVLELRAQTDRQRWLGRNHSVSQPMGGVSALPNRGLPAMAPDAEAAPSHPLDTGLDPVCALGVRLRIAPRGKAQLTFATTASDDAGTLRAVIDKYRQPSHVQRASLMSATLAGIRLRASRVSPESFAAIQTLTTALVQNLTRVAPKGILPCGDVCDRRLLWRFGISGDRPIVLVAAGATHGVGLLRSLAQALRLWAFSGVACDLVVVNAEPSSYLMPVHRDIATLRERHAAETAAEAGAQNTGFHVLRADELSNDELSTLQHLARVRMRADGRPLAHHVQEWTDLHEEALQARQDGSASAVPLVPARSVAVPASTGTFSAASAEFRFDVHEALRPSRPWVNVLANPAFGAQISEAGGGYTWALNSRMNQLTPWSNDPVADPPGEWFLLQDRKTMQVWSVAPSAWGEPEAIYRVAHGQGYTAISHRQGELEVKAVWCVDAHTSVKQVWLKLVNRGHKTRSLRAIGIAEWVMGQQRGDRSTVRTAVHRQRWPAAAAAYGAEPGTAGRPRLTTLLCTQLDRAAGFGDGTAFLALAAGAEASESDDDWTCDRRECFDARGRLAVPDHFGQNAGLGLDPCAALSTPLTVAPGATVECCFLLGYAGDPQAAVQLAVTSATVGAAQRMEQVRARWDHWLGATTVKTPDPLFDAMVNRWLLYQTMSSRLWAKAGFYQAGGATGFRDQLQDAMALAWAAPELLRAQIVVCASRQFPEGDVQHWWHAPGGAGVRTHFSDDLLWLPHAVSHYLRTTADAAVLDEAVPFLEGIEVPAGAEDAYYAPRIGSEAVLVYEHAARSIDRSLRTGAHGLPLMGTGDWNDGMNRVGHEGRGESVWLAWFLCRVVADFAPVASARGDTARAARWEAAARGWAAALQGAAWDGQWYRRAYFDDGSPLGSNTNAEARIDLIAQAWAVLSGVAPRAQQEAALASLERLLVDPHAGLLRLLDPPLQHAQPSAGYIQAYPPGVRENGGQYSHAGVWAVMAQAQAHRATSRAALLAIDERLPHENFIAAVARDTVPGDAAYRYFTYLSPAHRAAHPVHGPAYAIEPYVMAGDVYSQPPYVGRGGWSWYTGAAAWMHRAAIEAIFGLQIEGDTLRFEPCLPSHWPQAELTLRREGRSLRFVLVRATPLQARSRLPAGDDGAQARIVAPGEALSWRALADGPTVIVALVGATPGAPAAAFGEPARLIDV